MLTSTDDNPLVSAIVVTYNYARFVGVAIDSILAQTFIDPAAMEIIVVDDGSTDDTATVLATYDDRIKVITQANQGPSVAMSAGLAASRGKYVAFLDADDLWLDDHLIGAIAEMEESPAVGLVHGDMAIVDGDGALIAESSFAQSLITPRSGRLLGSILANNFVTSSCITMRGDLARSIPACPPWAYCRDWWLAAHTAQTHEILTLDRPVTIYRTHGANYNGLRDTSHERRVKLHRRDTRFSRELLLALDLSSVSLTELVQTWNRQLARAVVGAAEVGTTRVEFLLAAGQDNQLAQQLVVAGIRAAERDLQEAIRIGFKALAADPTCAQAAEFLTIAFHELGATDVVVHTGVRGIGTVTAPLVPDPSLLPPRRPARVACEQRPRVLVWRSQAGVRSEPWAVNQAAAMSRWDPEWGTATLQLNDLGVQPAMLTSTMTGQQIVDQIAEYDLVYAHFLWDALQIAPFAKAAGVPMVVASHGYDASTHDSWVRRQELAPLFAQAEAFVTDSGFIADCLVDLGADRAKVRTHHIGIEIPADVPDREPRSGVLVLGRLVGKKGVGDLIAALNLAPELRDVPVHIVGDGPLREELEIQSKGLNVVFHGWATPEQVGGFMRSAAVLCVPSVRAENGDSEGLPHTVLEAMAHRLPVVATRHSGIPEAVIDGETGLLAPERDPGQLAKALVQMLGDTQLRARFADAGRAWVEQEFDVNRQSMVLEDVFFEVCPQPSELAGSR